MNENSSKRPGVSRRQFIGGAGVLAAAGALAGLTGCAPKNSSQGATSDTVTFSFPDTVQWNAEYDVVVVGWGGAGSVAAITSAEAGANVLLAEKAPYGDEGGNTRYCEQFFCIPNTYEDGVAFFSAMAEGFDSATDEVIDFMAKGSTEIGEWLLAHGATTFSPHAAGGESSPDSIVPAEMATWAYTAEDGSTMMSEYPVWPDGTPMNGRVNEFHQVDEPDDEKKKYWNLLRTNVVALKDSIDVWFESPAVHLVQDPFSKTVVGVVIKRDSQEVFVRAKNGVVLACGSFEANAQMMQNFTQRTNSLPIGSLYNTGDGIVMGLEVGADLWHMDALSGPWIKPKYHDVERAILSANIAGQRVTNEGNCIYVGGDGKRFMDESGCNKHGHVNIGGTWMSQPLPNVMWAIMDSTARNGHGTIAAVEEAELIECNSVEELAQAIDLDPATLKATVDEWNGVVASGEDKRFGRLSSSLAPIETAPFYALRMYPACVNCQGGPKRNVECEVLDTNGNPIPHLYSAGELGSFWAGVYICGGNIAETVYSGRKAGENAAKNKDDLAPVELTLASSNPQYLGNDLDETESEAQVELGENEYLGTGQGLHGDIQAKVTVIDGKVTAVEVVKQTETPDVTKDVWTVMPQAMIEAGTAEVDTITGATIASEGLIAAVEDAVAQSK